MNKLIYSVVFALSIFFCLPGYASDCQDSCHTTYLNCFDGCSSGDATCEFGCEDAEHVCKVKCAK